MNKSDVEKLLRLADREKLFRMGMPGESVSVEYNKAARDSVPVLCRALLRAFALVEQWESNREYDIFYAVRLRVALEGVEMEKTK